MKEAFQLSRVSPGQAASEVFTSQRINVIQALLRKLVAGENLRSGSGISIRPGSGGPSISKVDRPSAQHEYPEQTFILAPYTWGVHDDGEDIKFPSDLIKDPSKIESLGKFDEGQDDEDMKLAQAGSDEYERDPTNLTALLSEFTIHGPLFARIPDDEDYIEFLMPGKYEIIIETESEIIPNDGADDALIMKWPVLGGANHIKKWYPRNPITDDSGSCSDGEKTNEAHPWYNAQQCDGYIVEDAVIFESPSGAGGGSIDEVWRFYGTTITLEDEQQQQQQQQGGEGEQQKEVIPAIRFLRDSKIIDFAGESFDTNYFVPGFMEKLDEKWWYIPLPYSEIYADDERERYIGLTLRYEQYNPMRLSSMGNMPAMYLDANGEWQSSGDVSYSAKIGLYDEPPPAKYGGKDSNLYIIEHTVVLGTFIQQTKKEVEKPDGSIDYVTRPPLAYSTYPGHPLTLWPVALSGLPTSFPNV
jgi:hypothetical protein